jgi:hypothetical protein
MQSLNFIAIIKIKNLDTSNKLFFKNLTKQKKINNIYAETVHVLYGKD